MKLQFNEFPISQNGARDKRYHVAREYCGKAKPEFVLRFCDEFIVSSPFYSTVLMRAVGHNAARNGALEIRGI